MVRPVVADTSVFIEVTRHPEKADRLLRLAYSQRLYISAIVAAELYAGTRSKQDKQVLTRLIQPLRRDGLFIEPSFEDCVSAGELIHRYGRQKGPLVAREHLADVLTVISAGRIGAQVLTYNLRHMQMWAAYAQAKGYDVIVGPYEKDSA